MDVFNVRGDDINNTVVRKFGETAVQNSSLARRDDFDARKGVRQAVPAKRGKMEPFHWSAASHTR